MPVFRPTAASTDVILDAHAPPQAFSIVFSYLLLQSLSDDLNLNFSHLPRLVNVSALTSLWSKTASLATSLDPFHERIDLKINNLCQMLSDLAQQIHILSLEDNKSDFSLEQLRKKRETTSLIDPSREVIGRREEKRKIVGFLQDKPRFQITQNRHQKEESTAESDVGICVVAIVGMPGIGKTTLAQAVFNNSWVDVPSRSLKTACFNRLSLNYLHVEGEGDSLHFPIRSFPQLNYLDFRSGLLDWNGGYDSCLERLYDLTIYGTLHFPEEGLCARNLTTLVIHGSDSLEALPKRMRSTLTSLRLLSVEECNELVSFPEDGLPTDLTTLAINKCGNLKVLPDRMLSSLTSLQSLSIESCNIHQSFPEGGLPASLRTLCIKDCPRLLMNLNNWPLRSLVSLEHLEIRGVRNVHFFPGRDLLPTTLTHLCLEMFYHLDILNGSELQRSCSQLEELKISNCDTAKFEAKEHGLQEIPPSLCSLEIYRCPLLEKWFRMELKRNPSKISHLCRIKIGGEEF
ncbi:hypothetical protein Ancab_029092 [Ancistrocladus abbreviatus]